MFCCKADTISVAFAPKGPNIADVLARFGQPISSYCYFYLFIHGISKESPILTKVKMSIPLGSNPK
jgi:hypothetical protein